MEKGTISAGFGQIFGSAGMSVLKTPTGVKVMCVKCQYCTLLLSQLIYPSTYYKQQAKR